MTEMLEEAILFAAEAHDGQVRKYTGEPYITHPVAVARIVETVPEHTEDMLIAAVLHDTVEDTETTLDDIERYFGNSVRELVFYLTDISQPEDGNRATRKAMDAAHNARGDWRAQTIKVADLLHNTACIKRNDPNFWKVYRREKERSLELLTLADTRLRQKAYITIQETE